MPSPRHRYTRNGYSDSLNHAGRAQGGIYHDAMAFAICAAIGKLPFTTGRYRV
jgi:hypothetical protein